MNCNFDISLITGHLDSVNTTAEDNLLQEHLKTCENCRQLLSVMKENDALLKDNAVLPPIDLTDRIMKQVRQNPKKSFRKTFYASLAVTGLAAAAMLGLFISGNIVAPNKDTATTVSMQAQAKGIDTGSLHAENQSEAEITEIPDIAQTRKSARPTAVLILHADAREVSIVGDAIDPLSLPDSVEAVGYQPTGVETGAYSVTWDELQRIFAQFGETYDAALYANPEATYTQGIIIFVE